MWTIPPQVLVGLGLGLTIDSLTQSALRDRVPRALHGGWTIAARHGGIVVGLVILTPIFTSDLKDAQRPAREAIAAQVLESGLPATSKLKLAEGLGAQLEAEAGRVPDLDLAFEKARLPNEQSAQAEALELRLDDQLERAATRAFRAAFLAAAALALLAILPALFLREKATPGMSSRGFALIAIALALSAGLLGVQLASGGADFVPQRAADPCLDRGRTGTDDLEGLAETVVLTGLDEAACKLGVSRERLLLAMLSKDDRAELARETGRRPRPRPGDRGRSAQRRRPTREDRSVAEDVGPPAVDRRPARHLGERRRPHPRQLGRRPAPDRRRAAPVARQARREHRPRGPRRSQVARVDPPRSARPRRARRGRTTAQGRTARPASGTSRLIPAANGVSGEGQPVALRAPMR